MPEHSFLNLVQLCDNAAVNRPSSVPSEFDSEQLTPLYLSPSSKDLAIGLLRPVIVEQLKLENERCRNENMRELWEMDVDSSAGRPSVSLASWLNTSSKRTAALKELSERWRDTGLFADVCGLKKWRAELYSVYKDPFGAHDPPSDDETSNFAFSLERSVCAIFGIVTYGCHLSIYQEAPDKQLKMWIPTRARTKQTWPGYLDNTVAGGLPSGMGVLESIVKECMEEASIPAEVVHRYARAAGCISYFFRTSAGWLQPEVEYVYDIAIPLDVDPTLFTPKPLDGEVESFELLDLTTIIAKMRAGLFKPNCALVIIDLLIRLGRITPENEPDYMKIITRLHGRFDYDRW